MFWQDSGDAFQQTLLSNEGKSLHMSWAKDRQQRWTVHFCWGQQYISYKQKCQFNPFVSKVIRCLVGMLLWTGSLLLCGRQPWEVAKSAGPLFQNCGSKPTYLPQRLTNPNPSWKKQPSWQHLVMKMSEHNSFSGLFLKRKILYLESCHHNCQVPVRSSVRRTLTESSLWC